MRVVYANNMAPGVGVVLCGWPGVCCAVRELFETLKVCVQVCVCVKSVVSGAGFFFFFSKVLSVFKRKIVREETRLK